MMAIPGRDKIYQEAIASRSTLLAAVRKDMAASSQGAPGPSSGLQRQCSPGSANDAGMTRNCAWYFSSRGAGIPTSTREPLWQETVVLDISEFGRTARENGDRGTDHGHGNVHWVLGGQVYGDWRGLAGHALHQDQDLPLATDFRSVLALVLHKHPASNMAIGHYVPPNFSPDYQHIQGPLT